MKPHNRITAQPQMLSEFKNWSSKYCTADILFEMLDRDIGRLCDKKYYRYYWVDILQSYIINERCRGNLKLDYLLLFIRLSN